MKKLFLILIPSLLFFIGISTVHAESPALNVGSYVLMDASTGRILDSKDPDEKRYPASTTKIMTAILALENGNMDQIMTASEAAIYDIGYDGSNAGIMIGEKLPMKDLLNALLICSANEAANILAENISPTRNDFINLMNKRAIEFGAKNTHFANTNGIYDPNHYTTAADMARFAFHAMKIPAFREIVCKLSYQMPVTTFHPNWNTLYNSNRLLYYNSDNFTVSGIKTGYTSQSGHNLVSSAYNKSGMELISVILDSKDETYGRSDFNNSYNLLEYGFKNYSIQKIIDSGSLVKSIPVTDAVSSDKLNLITAAALNCVLPNNKNEWNIKKDVSINTEIEAPVKKGDVLGNIKFTQNGILLKKINIVAEESVDKNFKAELRDFVNNIIANVWFQRIFITIILLFLFIIVLRLILRRISRTIKSKKKCKS